MKRVLLQEESEIRFGTDGWRAVISDKFTFKNVSIVAQGIAEWANRHLKKRHNVPRRVVVGYDTRFLSDHYAQIVSCILAANNIEVYLSDTSIPTPALSFGVRRLDCLAGIMITASHNPAWFNGIKIKTQEGGAASREVTDIVESYLYKTEVKAAEFEEAKKQKQIIIHDFKIDYVHFLKSYLDLKRIKNCTYRVLVDVMHGSGNGLIREVLKGTKVRLTLMRDGINPSFGGGKPEPIAENIQELMARVRKEKFDLGLVLDGDADRIAAVSSQGEYINPQKILGLLILHLVRNRGKKGGVVKTICGTAMIDNIADRLGLKLYETPVGFKYISDLMISENIVAGGEEAGGMGFQNYIPERDGTLAGLLLIEKMAFEEKSMKRLVAEMEKEFGRFYYERFDLETHKKSFDIDKVKSSKRILGKKVIAMKDFDGVKLICEDQSWLMFRPSGTEPLVRTYAEATSISKTKKLIKFGAAVVKKL